MKGALNRALPPRPAISCSLKPVLGGEAQQPLVLDGQQVCARTAFRPTLRQGKENSLRELFCFHCLTQTENSFLHVLDNFFDGPEFDPGYAKQEDEPIDDGISLPIPMRSSSVIGDTDSSPIVRGLSLQDNHSDPSSSAHRAESSLPKEFSIPLVITGLGEEDERESVLRSPTKQMAMKPRSMPNNSNFMPESPSRYLPPWINDTSLDFDDNDLYSQSFEQQQDEESV
jgi:hypothetical protein